MEYSVPDRFLAVVKKLNLGTDETLKLLEWGTSHPDAAWKVAEAVDAMAYRRFFQFAKAVSKHSPDEAVDAARREDELERRARNLKVSISKRKVNGRCTEFMTPSGVTCRISRLDSRNGDFAFELNPGGSAVKFHVGEHSAYDYVDSLVREGSLGAGWITVGDATVDGQPFRWTAPGTGFGRSNEGTIISEAVKGNIKPKVQALIGAQ